MVRGKAERFSWSKLLTEIVMKFGLFGVVSTILDLLWQIVFPLVGLPDYNNLVYKSVKVKSVKDEQMNDTIIENEDKETDYEIVGNQESTKIKDI